MSASVPHDDSILAPDVDPAARAEPKGPASPTPDASKLGRALEDAEVRSMGITGLFLIALFYTLYLARDLFLPIVLAILLNFLLSPVIRALTRMRIPPPLGAGLVILGLLGTLTLGAYGLAEPAQRWIARAPQTFSHAAAKLRKIRKPVEQVSKTAEQVQKATAVTPPQAPEVVVRGPTWAERLPGSTQTLIAEMLEVMILLYFLLAAGDLFLQKLIKVLPLLQDKKKAVQIARATESSISAYLFTVALVNVGEGVVIALVMWLLRMPNPALWGALTALLEFIPYIGALTMITVLTLAALTTFDGVGHALLIPASYLVINFVQANLVTPVVLGRRLTLNPVAIFIGLVFWWRIWGIPGAFVAVPLIATFKIFCDHIETLAPVGEFLGK